MSSFEEFASKMDDIKNLNHRIKNVDDCIDYLYGSDIAHNLVFREKLWGLLLRFIWFLLVKKYVPKNDEILFHVDFLNVMKKLENFKSEFPERFFYLERAFVTNIFTLEEYLFYLKKMRLNFKNEINFLLSLNCLIRKYLPLSKICLVCEREIVSRNHENSFCSKECFFDRKNKPCRLCGNEEREGPHLYNYYCSFSCKRAFQ